MNWMLTESKRVFLSFVLFGLINNILYVVILSAAIDLVGSSTPKAVVLLADIIPSFSIKMAAPFFIHLIPYFSRIWILVSLSSLGMLIVSLSPATSLAFKILGITLASLSSGLGEVSFLQLTHFYQETYSIGGFSMGTGGAGLLGSFVYLLLTNVIGLKIWVALLIFSVVPSGFVFAFYLLLPAPSTPSGDYGQLNMVDAERVQEEEEEGGVLIQEETEFETASKSPQSLWEHIFLTLTEIRPLVKPYMIPLCTVYISEYVINQGVSPTLLYPLDGLPHWLFKSYRDIYVVYGFLYQLGVFISRSSVNFGFRFKKLYWLSFLQFFNVLLTVYQSVYDVPFVTIWPLLILILYEGLLGGLLYVNTFMSVSEQVPKSKREFSMGCVGISDSFGVMLAGCMNWWLETELCRLQVQRGRDWCKKGG